jgi:SAM-dependent methyltransferase
VSETDPYRELVARSPSARFLDKNPGLRPLRSVLRRLTRFGAHVLDIGCGTGIGACHLVAIGVGPVVYTGVDPDPTACDVARAVIASLPSDKIRGRVVPQTIQQYLASDPPGADMILWNYAFHECVDARDEAAQAHLASAVTRLLRPEGGLVLGIPVIRPGASAEEIDRIYVYAGRLAGRAHPDPPFPDPDVVAARFVDAGLRAIERHDTPLSALADYLGVPHMGYTLLAFRREPVPARELPC